MQQYKFRGKRKSDGEWVYGSVVNSAGDMYIVDASGGLDSDFYDRPIWLDTWEVIPETVGMWTGKTDKNGKEVYPGDIQLDEVNDSYEICVFDTNSACFGFEVFGLNQWTGEGGQECYGNSMEPIEFLSMESYSFLDIVGNRWDNPELLK